MNKKGESTTQFKTHCVIIFWRKQHGESVLNFSLPSLSSFSPFLGLQYLTWNRITQKHTNIIATNCFFSDTCCACCPHPYHHKHYHITFSPHHHTPYPSVYWVHLPPKHSLVDSHCHSCGQSLSLPLTISWVKFSVPLLSEQVFFVVSTPSPGIFVIKWITSWIVKCCTAIFVWRSDTVKTGQFF